MLFNLRAYLFLGGRHLPAGNHVMNADPTIHFLLFGTESRQIKAAFLGVLVMALGAVLFQKGARLCRR